MLAKTFRFITATLLIFGTSSTAAYADSIREQQYWLEKYNILAAQNISKGNGVTVAIIDSGIDKTHPDLQGAIVGGTDVSGVGNSDGTLPIGDRKEHGTLVASILAGRGNNSSSEIRQSQKTGSGILGIAPEVDILSISVWVGSTPPEGVASIEEQIAEAVIWAVDNGADIINISLGIHQASWPEIWDDAFLYAQQKGVLIVAASGNGSYAGIGDIGAPATIPGVLAVAGVGEDRKVSSENSSRGITVAISAPSANLVGAIPGGGYAQWSGTSGAAPMISGVAALIKSYIPNIDDNNTINRIIKTAEQDVGATTPNPIYGYGVFQPLAAIEANFVPIKQNPLGDIATWIDTYRRQPSGEASSANTETYDKYADSVGKSLAPIAAPNIPYGDAENRPMLIPIFVFTIFGLTFFGILILGIRKINYALKMDKLVEENLQNKK